ncbi:MAG: hypothetical protein DSY83_12910 [Flavobacteriia bacterium]|nr:MAG: hypothetical protein DSY83_12910 [Flavobacteriia bacterium]
MGFYIGKQDSSIKRDNIIVFFSGKGPFYVKKGRVNSSAVIICIWTEAFVNIPKISLKQPLNIVILMGFKK